MSATRTDSPGAVATLYARLVALCSDFKLPTLGAELVPRFQKAGREDTLPLLLEVFELEAQDRMERRIDRLRRASHLPPGKTMATLDQDRLPRSLVEKLRTLARGDFLDEAHNVLCFGLPGTGKSHAASAIGHALVQAGHSVLFVPTYQLVQELLVAKRDLELPRALRRLDLYELVVLDDLGYVAQSSDEAEVLFTLLAERYERRSTLITSNLVFSQWERIFKNPMATAAAIDRLVHHAVILEFDVPSYRTAQARSRGERGAGREAPLEKGAQAGGAPQPSTDAQPPRPPQTSVMPPVGNGDNYDDNNPTAKRSAGRA